LQKNTAFIAYYNKLNKFSFNALIAALETDKVLSDIDVYFIKTKEELLASPKNIIQKYKNIVLGISFFTTQLWEILGLIQTLKKKFGKNIKYIAGGPHPTGDPKGTLEMGFDVAFLGEAEETFIEFLKYTKEKGDFHKIKGIAFFDENGEYVYTGKRKLINMNDYPPFPIKHSKFGPIEITRGCPYLCYFCQTPFISGFKPRHRSINSICKYVRVMKERSLTDIRFITPNAFSYGSLYGKNVNLDQLDSLLRDIAEILAPKGRIFLGSFPSEVRPEHVSEDSLDLIRKYCANDNIIIGAQSGSQKILDLCNRGHTVDDVYDAVKLTLSKQLKVNVDFIFGLPDEQLEDIRITIAMMKDLAALGARIHTHSFIPLPQTPFAKRSPKKIHKSIKKAIGELASKGFAFGEFQKQERLGIKISKYLKTKKLK
jgi:B12-binding domain/radical SAM domain protein